MLYNLQELETNLISIFQDLTALNSKFKSKESSTQLNKKSFLLKLPRVILLQNVFGFLSDEDIVKVSSVCQVMRNAIYSPFGWKILSYTRSQIKYKYKVDKVEEQQYGIEDNIEGLGFEVDKESIAMIQEKRKILKATLKEQYEAYMSAKEKYSGMVQTIKVEKKLQTKYKDKSKILESQLQTFEQKNNNFRQSLKLLDAEYRSKMKKLESEENEIMQERNKLQNQKEAFVTKIREYQLEIEKTKKESGKAQEMLKKVKSFLTTREI